MKPLLVTWLSSARGRFISLAVGLVAGLTTKILTQWNLEISPDDSTLIASLVTAIVGWGLDIVVIKLNSDGTKALQAPLPGIKEDGVPGPATIAAVEMAVAKSE